MILYKSFWTLEMRCLQSWGYGCYFRRFQVIHADMDYSVHDGVRDGRVASNWNRRRVRHVMPSRSRKKLTLYQLPGYSYILVVIQNGATKHAQKSSDYSRHTPWRPYAIHRAIPPRWLPSPSPRGKTRRPSLTCSSAKRSAYLRHMSHSVGMSALRCISTAKLSPQAPLWHTRLEMSTWIQPCTQILGNLTPRDRDPKAASRIWGGGEVRLFSASPSKHGLVRTDV